MTLPPEKIGDKGQRYEIWCDDEDGEPMRLGWSDTPDGFKEAVEAHPSWTNHRCKCCERLRVMIKASD